MKVIGGFVGLAVAIGATYFISVRIKETNTYYSVCDNNCCVVIVILVELFSDNSWREAHKETSFRELQGHAKTRDILV